MQQQDNNNNDEQQEQQQDQIINSDNETGLVVIVDNDNDDDDNTGSWEDDYDEEELEDGEEGEHDIEDDDDDDEEEEQQKKEEEDLSHLLGCSHYKRNCQIKAPCCNQYFWCRFCHNEQVANNLIKFRNDKSAQICRTEEMDRFGVKFVKCMSCQHEQELKGEDDNDTLNKCQNCSITFAKYACGKCKFFNNDPHAQIFHCDECGMCRRGNPDDFVHCKVCAACMPKGDHKCVTQSLHHNCAVCLEFLFTSTRSSIILPNCGHSIHSHCYTQLIRSGAFTCPLCSKCMFKDEGMQAHYEQLDREIAATPMPDEYKNLQVNILCNDCLESSTVPFHIFGLKCQKCGGYNTRKK